MCFDIQAERDAAAMVAEQHRQARITRLDTTAQATIHLFYAKRALNAMGLELAGVNKLQQDIVDSLGGLVSSLQAMGGQHGSRHESTEQKTAQ